MAHYEPPRDLVTFRRPTSHNPTRSRGSRMAHYEPQATL